MASKQSEQLITMYKGWMRRTGRQSGDAARRASGDVRTLGRHNRRTRRGGLYRDQCRRGARDVGGAKGLRGGSRTALCAWRRLRVRIDVHPSQGLRPFRQGDRLPRTHRPLRTRAREHASRTGQRYGGGLPLAAGPGHQAEPHRADRRFSRRRTGCHHHPACA